MNDYEIRKFLSERKKAKREMQRANRRESFAAVIGWSCWAALGYMMFLGAYMVR